MSEPSTPLVDTHTHIFQRSEPFQPTGYRPDFDFPVDSLVRTLDENHVPFAVISAASFHGFHNQHVLDALSAQRRLRATAIVPPDIDERSLQSLDAAGVVGVRLQYRTAPTAPDLTSPPYQDLFRRLVALDWHVQVLAHGERLAMMLSALSSAGVKIVIDHFGLPDVEGGGNCVGMNATRRALQTGRAWVRLSAPYRFTARPETAAQLYLAEAGPDRMLWGSDCPWTGHEGSFSYRDTLDWFAKWIPNPADRRRIDWSALRLYRFV